MIVVCEGCERRFQLDDSRIPPGGARVRCKYCQHRFRVSPPGDASTEAPAKSAPAPSAPESPAAKAGDSLGGFSAAAPGQISAEDTLFGSGEITGGAPIDGDRSLFGTIDDDDDSPMTPVMDSAPSEPTPGPEPDDANEASSGGLTQDLQFVEAPPMEPEDEAGGGAPVEPPGPEPAEAAPPEPPAQPEPAPAEAPAEAAAEAPAEAAAEPDLPPDPGEDSGTEGSWEFVDSDLSLHDAAEPEEPEDPEPAVAADAEPEAAPAADEEADEAMEIDPGASHPGVSDSVVDEQPSMRAVPPDTATDGAVFEMVESDDEAVSLELEGDASAAARDDEAEPATAAAAPEPAGDAPTPEIGTAADWDRLASDDAPAGEVAEPEDLADLPAAFAEPEPEEAAPVPDLGHVPDDLPEPAVIEAARGGNAWLEHAGWALSLVLLLAVAQGTVRIEPAAPPSPPGQVEVAGLVADNVRGRFVENAQSGTLFVVSGELQNRGGAYQAGGELRVVVLDEHGFTFEGQHAPVGPALSEAQVRESPLGALQQRQARQAQVLGAQPLAPGEGVSFQAILGELPDGAARFRLEPAPAAPEPALPLEGGFEDGAPEAGQG